MTISRCEHSKLKGMLESYNQTQQDVEIKKRITTNASVLQHTEPICITQHFVTLHAKEKKRKKTIKAYTVNSTAPSPSTHTWTPYISHAVIAAFTAFAICPYPMVLGWQASVPPLAIQSHRTSVLLFGWPGVSNHRTVLLDVVDVYLGCIHLYVWGFSFVRFDYNCHTIRIKMTNYYYLGKEKVLRGSVYVLVCMVARLGLS